MRMEPDVFCPQCFSTNIGELPAPPLLGTTFFECYECCHYWRIPSEVPEALSIEPIPPLDVT